MGIISILGIRANSPNAGPAITSFIIASLNWISLSNGLIFGHISSLVSSLQKKEDGVDFSEGQISTIAATLPLMSIFGVVSSALITDKVGRRWPYIIFSISAAINWIILYYAKEMNHFILSRMIAGISVGALGTLNIFITSEYTSPNTRAFFLNMVTTVAPAIGSCFIHAIGIVLSFRTVALIGLTVISLGAFLPYFWVESPHWLALKGRFRECETAFQALHGTGPDSERELELLIKTERSKLKRASETNNRTALKRLSSAMKRKYFWGLILLSFLIQTYIAAAGKAIFTILATVLLEEITGTSDVLFFTLLLDGFTFIGSCMSCVLIRRTSMRTLLFSTGFTANVLLVVFSLCFYLKDNQGYIDWINVTILGVYFTIINAGPYPILEAIVSEMFPLELKVYVFFVSGLILVLSSSLSIILLPYTINAIGYHGLFLVNATIMFVCLGYIWLKLPETKGKTLQEIEVYFKTNNFDIDEVLSSEQMKALI